MYYGAVDIGTNSCRLLIAQINDDNKPITAYKALETTRMGEGMNQSRFLNKEAIDRTLLCLSHFREKLQEYRIDKYRTIATSAIREAENRDDFIYRVRAQTGIKVDVVNGEEEASLSYEGVVKGLDLPNPPLVVDLGGGSTEFICPDQTLLLSVPIGAVKATEADMTASQIIELLKPLAEYKQQLRNHPLVIVGGTATSLVAIQKGLIEYDAEKVHGEILNRGAIGDLYNLLERMPLALRRRLPGLQPERADIINKGALIILVIMEILGHKEMIVSETDLLEGIIWSLVESDAGKQ